VSEYVKYSLKIELLAGLDRDLTDEDWAARVAAMVL
jgi:hypothetical protein